MVRVGVGARCVAARLPYRYSPVRASPRMPACRNSLALACSLSAKEKAPLRMGDRCWPSSLRDIPMSEDRPLTIASGLSVLLFGISDQVVLRGMTAAVASAAWWATCGSTLV